jgi:hypothetical protein
MRIYLATATTNLVHNYTPINQIHQLILDLKHTHTTNWYQVEDKKIIPIPSTDKTADKIKKEILRSDLMVAEISLPSFGLGYHVCLAKTYHIPVLCLYYTNYKKNISPTLNSMISSNFMLVEYNDQNLKEILSQGLNKLTPKNTRFNFNLNPKDYQYLNLLSQEAKKTKTEIIHDLITEKIRSEKF